MTNSRTPFWLKNPCVQASVLSASLVMSSPLLANQLAMAGDMDLTDLSLESLMDIEVFSVSKVSEKLHTSAAAIYVLTGYEIKRAGVNTVPEALRLVPGLMVARSDAHTWVVSARGFSSNIVDKMEVQLDGRSLYTPLFSGVFWQQHNIVMEDIERIEVIRGPGAALWGANAVNGVINIITKSAADTTSMVKVAGGKELEGMGAFSASGRLGAGHVRVYERRDSFDDQELRADHSDAKDRFSSRRLGFRSDWELNDQQSLIVQGETYRDEIEPSSLQARLENLKETNQQDHVMARWSGRFAAGRELEIKYYFEETRFDVPYVYRESRRTQDIDIRYSREWGNRHHVVLGGGYRYIEDESDNVSIALIMDPAKRDYDVINFFLQDQMVVLKDRLKVTLGTKFERNDFSGNEIQPSLRAAFTPSAQTTVWSAISKAVRTPTRLDQDSIFSGGSLVGSEHFESEEALAYELGFRQIFNDDFSADLALFYNEYDKLRTVNYNPLILFGEPAPISNGAEAFSSGAELVLNWRPAETVSVLASYNYLELDITAKPGSGDPNVESTVHNDGYHNALLHVSWDVSSQWSLDGRVRNVSKREFRGTEIDGYTGLDFTLNWSPLDELQLSLLAQNVFDPAHNEFSSTGVEIERNVVLAVKWTFE